MSLFQCLLVLLLSTIALANWKFSGIDEEYQAASATAA